MLPLWCLVVRSFSGYGKPADERGLGLSVAIKLLSDIDDERRYHLSREPLPLWVCRRFFQHSTALHGKPASRARWPLWPHCYPHTWKRGQDKAPTVLLHLPHFNELPPNIADLNMAVCTHGEVRQSCVLGLGDGLSTRPHVPGIQTCCMKTTFQLLSCTTTLMHLSTFVILMQRFSCPWASAPRWTDHGLSAFISACTGSQREKLDVSSYNHCVDYNRFIMSIIAMPCILAVRSFQTFEQALPRPSLAR